MMKTGITSLLCLITAVLFIQARPLSSAFDKTGFYKAIGDGNIEVINKQLQVVETASNIEKDAYTGALLMKKAGMVKKAGEKLNLFKEGRKKLESAISKDNDNGEWRFLRLIIQEHAPKIVNYRNDIKKDADFIVSNFKKLSPEVQSAVMDYRKQSNTLQPLNF
jgi:hypothetical protein